ncbi:MAG: pyrroline-5-carboxylate reductase [Candidatus Eisenbacteria bacterium]|uniref:Pyrroline-5-carboxylate reductase n=1 Tax=Eiseniibacteriota bacterium TaxID=2212470 RepID=A0A538UCI7_UNCEI|nr:MAG: pyrroline-5-carboxylate reductase [Candidatus Eisenbacteria bacterium]
MPHAGRLAVLGAGRLGEALIRGMIDAEVVRAEDVTVTAGHAERVAELERALGVRGAASNAAAVRGADLVILGVKPQTVPAVLGELRDVLEPAQLLISVAASVGTAYIEKHLNRKVPVIRAMPNTPALIRRGMTALAAGAHAGPEHLEAALRLFRPIGHTVLVDEKHMNAVTALSACGPAFIYVIIESLAEGGVKVGLPRNLATELAAQTVLGAGAMVLETGEHPAKLKDLVTTPAGCTIDGLLELEEGGIRVTLIKTIVRSTQRAKELLENG